MRSPRAKAGDEAPIQAVAAEGRHGRLGSRHDHAALDLSVRQILPHLAGIDGGYPIGAVCIHCRAIEAGVRTESQKDVPTHVNPDQDRLSDKYGGYIDWGRCLLEKA